MITCNSSLWFVTLTYLNMNLKKPIPLAYYFLFLGPKVSFSNLKSKQETFGAIMYVIQQEKYEALSFFQHVCNVQQAFNFFVIRKQNILMYVFVNDMTIFIYRFIFI